MNYRGSRGIRVVRSQDGIHVSRTSEDEAKIEVSSFAPVSKVDVSTLDFYSYADGEDAVIMPGTLYSPHIAYAGVVKIPDVHNVTPGASQSGYIYLEIPMFQPPTDNVLGTTTITSPFVVGTTGYAATLGTESDQSDIDLSWVIADPGYVFYSSLQTASAAYYRKLICTVETDADGLATVFPVHLGILTLPEGAIFYFSLIAGEA